MADDRWRPKHNVLCRIEPDEAEVSPPGVWQALAHGPDHATSWWLMPISADAVLWAGQHPAQVISNCVQVRGNRLVPNRTYAEGAWSK